MSSRRYFGGDSICKGNSAVYPLKGADDWPSLFQNFISTPVELKVTMAEYDDLDEDEQKLCKDRHYLTGCTFKEGHYERANRNVEALSLLILDIDAAPEGYADYAQQFCDSPEDLYASLHPYNFASYETISSRPGARCLRIIISLEECGPEHRTRIFNYILKRLAMDPKLWKGQKESRTLSQGMYRPVRFAGSDPQPIIAQNTRGEDLSLLDVPEDAGDDSDPYGGLPAYNLRQSGDSPLTHLRIPDLAVEDIEEPLNVIDPDLGYHDWIKIFAAMKHQFGGTDLEEEALECVLTWSSGGVKFRSEDEVRRKWASLVPCPPDRVPATVRTIFKQAMGAGWSHTKLTEKVTLTAKEWIDECDNLTELQHEGIKRIALIPSPTTMGDEDLATVLRKRLVALGGSASVATIKKAVREARSEDRRERREDKAPEPPEFLRGFVLVAPEGRFFNFLTNTDFSPQAFDLAYSLPLLRADKEIEELPNGKPLMLPQHYATTRVGLQQVDGKVYDPSKGDEERIITEDGRAYVNIYRQASLPIVRDHEPKLAKVRRIIMQHAEILCGLDDNAAHIFLCFLAMHVQFPGFKIPWATFIQSAEGAGKGLISRMMEGALGKENVNKINSSMMAEKYNTWAFDKQLGVFEEFFTEDKSRRTKMNQLKDIITDTRASRTQKYKDATTARLVANFIIFSNGGNVLAPDEWDRRYFVIRSPLQSVGAIAAAKADGHFDRVAWCLQHPGAIRKFLSEYPIDDDFPRYGPAPRTEFHRELVEQGKSRLHLAVEELLEDPAMPLVGRDVVHLAALKSRLQLHDPRAGEVNPAPILRQLGFETFAKGKTRTFLINGARTPVWVHCDEYDSDLGDPTDILRERMDRVDRES